MIQEGDWETDNSTMMQQQHNINTHDYPYQNQHGNYNEDTMAEGHP